MSNLDLFSGIQHEPLTEIVYGGRQSIQERFETFHRANPHVYTNLRTLARGLIGKGRQHYGIGSLFEVLRWHHAMMTTDLSSEFKLNNDYRSRYARLLMEREQDLAGFFYLRELQTP